MLYLFCQLLFAVPYFFYSVKVAHWTNFLGVAIFNNLEQVDFTGSAVIYVSQVQI